MMGDISAAAVALLAVFLVLSAFFSGSEAALLSVQQVRIRALVANGTAGASRVARMVERKERLLPPILLGNNLVNTGAAAVATSIAITIIADESVAVAAATGAVTVVLLIFGETIPKTIAARYPERSSIVVGPVIQAVMWALRPVSWGLIVISTALLKFVGGGRPQGGITGDVIRTVVEEGREHGAVDEGEAAMIRRVLEFGDRRIAALMTPRTEIVAIPAGTTIGTFLALYSEHYHTRFPVTGADLDDIVGLVGVKDVLAQLAAGAAMDSPLVADTRPVRFVPETKLVSDLFDEMRASGDQLAMIADEYGGVAGLVTLKRLVETIVGRAREEEERREESPVRPLDENAVELDGRLTIVELDERLSLGVPQREGDYETIAGFLLWLLGKIPVEGDVVSYGNLHFAVLEMRGPRIARIRVTRSHVDL